MHDVDVDDANAETDRTRGSAVGYSCSAFLTLRMSPSSSQRLKRARELANKGHSLARSDLDGAVEAYLPARVPPQPPLTRCS